MWEDYAREWVETEGVESKRIQNIAEGDKTSLHNLLRDNVDQRHQGMYSKGGVSGIIKYAEPEADSMVFEKLSDQADTYFDRRELDNLRKLRRDTVHKKVREYVEAQEWNTIFQEEMRLRKAEDIEGLKELRRHTESATPRARDYWQKEIDKTIEQIMR